MRDRQQGSARPHRLEAPGCAAVRGERQQTVLAEPRGPGRGIGLRADEEQARSLGIRGVPFFVFDGRHAVSGAHPSDTLLAALTSAWQAANARAPEFAEGASCGPDGCA